MWKIVEKLNEYKNNKFILKFKKLINIIIIKYKSK